MTKFIPTVQMVQETARRWHIVATKSQCVLQKDINAYSVEMAEEYIKRYVTSFSGWTYEVIPLKK